MTTRAKMELKGLSAYLEDIANMGKDVDAAAQRALQKGAEPIHAEMQRLVPVDTGDLKQHVTIEGPYQEGNVNYVLVGVVTADADTAIKGNVQEYGSPSKNIKAQPYIRPAIDAKAAAARKAIRESLKSEGFVE